MVIIYLCSFCSHSVQLQWYWVIHHKLFNGDFNSVVSEDENEYHSFVSGVFHLSDVPLSPVIVFSFSISYFVFTSFYQPVMNTSLRNVFIPTTAACMRHHSKFKAPNLKRAPLMIDQLRLFIYPAVHPRCNRYLLGGPKGKRLSGYLFLWRMCSFP